MCKIIGANTLGLQLIDDYCRLFYNKKYKKAIATSRNQKFTTFRSLILSEQQSKTQRYFVWDHRTLNNPARYQDKRQTQLCLCYCGCSCEDFMSLTGASLWLQPGLQVVFTTKSCCLVISYLIFCLTRSTRYIWAPQIHKLNVLLWPQQVIHTGIYNWFILLGLQVFFWLGKSLMCSLMK